MKRTFLLIVIPALLIALGFAQTPAASSTPDQTIKGCLAGSDGNYTVAEDGTGHIFKVTASSVDFKQHVGHEVALIGHRASAASPDVADSSFAVTELNMISEHCAVAAAVPTATVTTPADNAVPPPAAAAPTGNTVAETEAVPAADAAAPAAPVATVITPAETSITPTVNATPPAETNIAPAVDAAAPAAPASTQAWDKSAADAADQAVPIHSRRRSATTAAVATAPNVTASESAETASEPAAAAASPAAPASTPSPTAATPDAAATPAAPARHATALVLLIGFALLVILIGIMVPSLSRWRKRRSLEQTGAPNLSFTREASSDQKKTDTEEPRKVA
jgi:hypothetical protein